MCQSPSNRERGSALIEAVVIGSAVFLIVMASVSAAIEVAVAGDAARESARVGAVHGARHAGPEAARAMAEPGPGTAEAERSGEAVRVVVVDPVEIAHPDGSRSLDILGIAEMPLAPFRSDRG